MTQVIKEINIEKLVLWTENPRDPIDKNAKDQDIAERAWIDKNEKWNLIKLAKEMKSHYDFSELPTIVYHDSIPIVYDGNRRMILAKIKHNCVNLEGADEIELPDIPIKIPCNVCTEDIAILNVYRKHGDSGSWSPLDRDIFLVKFMNEPKSTFLKLEETTGMISSNPHLNKGFVKNEIFNNDRLEELGFTFEDDLFLSKHTNKESKSIFENISKQVALKNISTRRNRGKVIEVLDKENRSIVENNKNKDSSFVNLIIDNLYKEEKKRKASRTKIKSAEIFNGDLYLKQCRVSDLYRDIVDLYGYYLENKSKLSQYFPSLIRMSMRLLCETAARDLGKTIDEYLKSNFKIAKKKLSQDEKTTLSTQNVKEITIIQLLHIGAHNFTAANNIEQTVAISMILGPILEITHGN